jgi:hypothetical protein
VTAVDLLAVAQAHLPMIHGLLQFQTTNHLFRYHF